MCSVIRFFVQMCNLHSVIADTFSWKNDLALVKLTRDLPMAPENPRIDVAQLPIGLNTTWPPPGTNCSLQGWGCTQKGTKTHRCSLIKCLPIYTVFTESKLL